jgi:hypothetical protein
LPAFAQDIAAIIFEALDARFTGGNHVAKRLRIDA